jgi:uncharacterized Tic20 family protein
MKYEDLKLLDELREKGSITQEEYQREKEKILYGTPPPNPTSLSTSPSDNDDRFYAIFMHLSQFISSIIIPLIMWVVRKDSSRNIDQHGKNIINFTISYFIYAIGATGLSFFCIGVPVLIVLAILIPIFIIIATIKAANDEAWKYPLTIEFLK